MTKITKGIRQGLGNSVTRTRRKKEPMKKDKPYVSHEAADCFFFGSLIGQGHVITITTRMGHKFCSTTMKPIYRAKNLAKRIAKELNIEYREGE